MKARGACRSDALRRRRALPRVRPARALPGSSDPTTGLDGGEHGHDVGWSPPDVSCADATALTMMVASALFVHTVGGGRASCRGARS